MERGHGFGETNAAVVNPGQGAGRPQEGVGQFFLVTAQLLSPPGHLP